MLSEQKTGGTCTRDAILYSVAVEKDDLFVTEYILGCPVCGAEYGRIIPSDIPDDEWSEWTYDGCGSHSRYWLKDPTVIQRKGCTRVNETYTTCDTCGGPYTECGIALAPHPIKVWLGSEVVCVIPTGATYTMLENSDIPYVEYNGVKGYINWQDVTGLISVPVAPCTDPAGHDWKPVENCEPVRNCTDIQTFCECTYCGATRWIIESTGKEHPKTDAVLHSPCSETWLGCPECGQVISNTKSGRDCEIKDALLMIDHASGIAYLGCPVCNFTYDRLDINAADDEAWSPWVCSGNGTHSRYFKDHPDIVITESCSPGNEAETICGVCGGAYINRVTYVATEDIEMFSAPEYVTDDGSGYGVICIIPERAVFIVSSKGDVVAAEYNGLSGYISSAYVYFGTDEGN